MEVPARFRSVLVGFHYWLLAFVFLATSTFLLSCSGGGTSVVITDNTASQQTVADDLNFVLTVTVTAGETYDIDVLATYLNAPVNGETITFTVIQSESGSNIDGTTVVNIDTDNGLATVTYTAGFLGADLDADPLTVKDIIQIDSTDLTGTVTITVTPPGADLVEVEAQSSTLDADGIDRTLITATVTAGGSPVENLEIDFTTTAGTVCVNPAPGPLPGDCSATQVPDVLTDFEGKARIILQASTNLETATVEAVTPDFVTGSDTVTFIAGPPAIITLQANPTNLQADGSSTSDVTALVTDADGHLVADGTEITFSVTAGDGSFPFGAPPTTVGGLVTSIFTAGTDETNNGGVVDILASALGGTVDSGTSGDGLITLTAEAVDSITISPDPIILTANGLDTAAVTAEVLNASLDPVNPATPVNFATNPNDGTAGDLDTTTPVTPGTYMLSTSTAGLTGIATVYLQASTVAGNYSLTATSGGKIDVAIVEFVAGLADVGNSFIFVTPGSIEANGSSTATLTVTALDAFSNPVSDGTAIDFTTDAGTFQGSGTATVSSPTTNGVATATIVSSSTPTDPVNLDAFIDDGSALTLSTTMIFGDNNSINPNYIVLTLSGGRDGDGTDLPIESPLGNFSTLITAEVFDAAGNPAPDCPNNIDFSIFAGPADAELDGNTGTLVTPVVKSTVGGTASVSLTPGITPGTVRIRVRSILESDCTTGTIAPFALTTPITIASGSAALINLFPESDVEGLPGDFTGQFFNAQVTDAYGNPVQEGTAIRFYLDNFTEGDVCPWGETGRSISEVDPACSTNAVAINGVARTLLSYGPSFRWGTFTLNAETEFGTVTDSYAGDYLSVEPVTITVNFPAGNTVLSGDTGITVEALYEDGSGVPFAGRTLTFSSDNTSLANFSILPANGVTDADGIASVSTLDITQCLDDDTVTIRASESPYTGSEDLTINGTAPTADFTFTVGGDTVSFNSTSTTPAGTAIDTYAWDFGDGVGTDTVPAPSYTFTTNGSYAVSLDIDNNAAGNCADSVTKVVTIDPGCCGP
jgi:adhesin/invasin